MLGETIETITQNGDVFTDESGNPIVRTISLPEPLTRTIDVFGKPIPIWLLLIGAVAVVAAMSDKGK